MKRFKKRTIALVLASVITVAGSFAASNYKNSLMSLKFDTAESGGINMSVETKSEYLGNLSLSRRDANTYVLTLSEMNSMIKGMPNIEKVSSDISSVEIKTLPYSNNAKGYTRVIIKTYNPVKINAENKIYIPSKDERRSELIEKHFEAENITEEFSDHAEEEKQELKKEEEKKDCSENWKQESVKKNELHNRSCNLKQQNR